MRKDEHWVGRWPNSISLFSWIETQREYNRNIIEYNIIENIIGTQREYNKPLSHVSKQVIFVTFYEYVFEKYSNLFLNLLYLKIWTNSIYSLITTEDHGDGVYPALPHYLFLNHTPPFLFNFPLILMIACIHFALHSWAYQCIG